MSITISTTAAIDAPSTVVWDVLTDFAAYRDWNPSMRIEGAAVVGTKLDVHMGGGGRGMSFKPTVLAASGQELRWLGKLGFSGIANGEHFFILTSNADGSTCLTHGERYSGVLVALIKPFMRKGNSQSGYEDSNRVFKRHVEGFRDSESDLRLYPLWTRKARQARRHRDRVNPAAHWSGPTSRLSSVWSRRCPAGESLLVAGASSCPIRV